MPRVLGPDGADLGDVTSPAALDYYQREAGYEVHDDVDVTIDVPAVDTAVIPGADGGENEALTGLPPTDGDVEDDD